MDPLIFILFLLAIVLLVIQLGLIKKKPVIYLILTGLGAFIYFLHPKAIEQNSISFQADLGGSFLVDLMVLQVAEAVAGILLAIFLISYEYDERGIPAFRFLKFIPGPFLFFALFYLESYAYMNITGMNFQRMAIVMALAVPTAALILRYLLKWFLPENDLLLELKFIFHFLQLVVAAVVTVKTAGLPLNSLTDQQPLPGLLLLSGLFITGILWGRIQYHRRINKQIKKQNT